MSHHNVHVPTDLAILEYIYQTYYGEYIAYDKDPSIRETKMFIPIDFQHIAEHFNTDGDIIFGRLYYHLENKYGYVRNDLSHTQVHFFAFNLNKSINFPYLTSVLADLKDQNNRFNKTRNLSRLALLIAAISLAVTMFDKISTFEKTVEPTAELIKHTVIEKK